MITIWGRANSVNVQKVLWCCDELVLPYERIDAGMQFGRNNEPEYLAMNPNARVPTLVDGDFVLWESNSILRYLVMQYAPASPLYPPEPRQRASIDRWLDWSLSTLQPAERPEGNLLRLSARTALVLREILAGDASTSSSSAHKTVLSERALDR